MVVTVINFSDCPGNRNRPLHPLSLELRRYVLSKLSEVERDASVTSIVLTGGGEKGEHFSAGADITELEGLATLAASERVSSKRSVGSSSEAAAAPPAVAPPPHPSLRDVVNRIEACQKPVIAAVSGSCLGGGLEVALACHYRVCSGDSTGGGGGGGGTKLGLPEVLIGLLPGAGGTQRLPRLVGLQHALRLILTGKPVTGEQALRMGLVDAVLPAAGGGDEGGLLVMARKWAAWAEVMPLEPRRLSQRTVPESAVEAHVVLHTASLSLPPSARGGQAVHAALEAVRGACTMPFQDGMRAEAAGFMELLSSQQSRALRHAFFAVRRAQKPALGASSPSPKPDAVAAISKHPLLTASKNQEKVETAVIGAGTMGSGIALVLLQAGYTVYLVDVSKKALDKGVGTVRATLQSMVRRKRVSRKQADRLLSNLKGTVNIETDLRNCLLVVEAVVENMTVKKKIFTTLQQVTPVAALLLTNTSTLDIDVMAESVLTDPSRRGNFAGWHFFSPAHLMKLVEIVVGKTTTTSPYTVALLQALTKRIGKIGVVVGNCDGFVGNRMLKPYGQESGMLLTEGGGCRFSVDRVDAALRNFGLTMGIFQMGDLAGNDIEYNIRLARGWARRSKGDPVPTNRPARYTELGDELVRELGRLGQKAGKGWYDYNPDVGKGRQPLPSPEVADLIRRHAVTTAIPANTSGNDDDEYIVRRVLFPLVNEGFKCLQEGVARHPADIDVIYIYGYGWPAWRGGPMHWACHEVGLSSLLDCLRRFSRQLPNTPHYEPARLLEECVERDITVEEYYDRKQRARSRL